jgi:hypothetical protein
MSYRSRGALYGALLIVIFAGCFALSGLRVTSHLLAWYVPVSLVIYSAVVLWCETHLDPQRRAEREEARARR